MNDVFVGEVCHSAVLGIFDIVVIGIVVLNLVLHVVALLLCLALGCISSTYTSNLFRDGEHTEHLGMEIARRRVLLTEYVTNEISRYFLLLVIVMELNAELLLQRIDNVRHRLVGKVLLVCIHTEYACTHLSLLNSALAGDARHFVLAHSYGLPIANNGNNLCIFEYTSIIERSSVRFLDNLIRHLTILHLLYILVLRIFEFQSAATTARVEPFVHVFKKVLYVLLAIGLLLKKTLLHITFVLQSSFHGFVVLRVIRPSVKRFYVVGAFCGEEAETVHIANGC